MNLIEVDNDALTNILRRLAELSSCAGPWPEGPPGYRLASVSGGVYVGYAEPDNDDGFLTVVYDADDEPVFVVTPDLLAVGEWTRGPWEAAFLGCVQ